MALLVWTVTWVMTLLLSWTLFMTPLMWTVTRVMTPLMWAEKLVIIYVGIYDEYFQGQ